MGRKTEDIPFFSSVGINTAISEFQGNIAEAITALNVYFKRYGQFGAIVKRKGKARINAVAADGDIIGIYSYTLADTQYLTAYTNEKTLYDVNISTGALTAFGYGLADYPTAQQFNDRTYFSNSLAESIVNLCEATTDFSLYDLTGGGAMTLWTTANEGTYSIKAENDTSVNELGVELDDLNFSFKGYYLEFDVYLEDTAAGIGNMTVGDYVVVYFEDSGGIVGKTNYIQREPRDKDESFIKGWNHIILDPLKATTGISTFDPDSDIVGMLRIAAKISGGGGGKIVAVDNIKLTPKQPGIAYVEDSTALYSPTGFGIPTGVNDIEVYDGRLFAVTKDTIYWSNVNAGYDFSDRKVDGLQIRCVTTENSAVVAVDDTSMLQVGMSVSGYGIPAASTIASIDSRTQITLSAAIANDVDWTWTGLLNFGNVASVAYYGKVVSGDPVNRIRYLTSTTGIKSGDEVTGIGIPANTVVAGPPGDDWVFLDKAPTTFDAWTEYTFTDPDGLDITLGGEDASNMKIDEEEDPFTACVTLGDQLILFKNYKIFRLIYTNNESIPYRIKPVYTGDAKEIGVGCVAKRTIKHVSLGVIAGEEIRGAQEYLTFESTKGLYVIGVAGGPIKIDNKIENIIQTIPEANRGVAFSAVHPEKNQYWFFYPQGGNTYCSDQLIYGLITKAWSQYDFDNMTAAATYPGATKTYVIMGDKDGFLYKHDYQTTDALNDWRDQDKTGAYVAIDAQWQSHYMHYGYPGRFKSLLETELMVVKTTPDCPITWTLYNEDSNSATGSIATTGTTAWVNTRIDTGLYGKYLSHKFSNAVSANSMEIKFWLARIKPTGAA